MVLLGASLRQKLQATAFSMEVTSKKYFIAFVVPEIRVTFIWADQQRRKDYQETQPTAWYGLSCVAWEYFCI